MREDHVMAARRHHVVSVLVPDMTMLEASVASEVFGVDRDVLGVRWYRHTFCTEIPGRVPLYGGPPVIIDDGLEALRRADTILIPGWCGVSNPPSDALVEALVRAHRRGARIATFCTGAFAMASTGLLDGRRATTHWHRAELFAERFPTVELDPDVLFVDDGDLLTSAGSAASIDLALHLVRRDFGAEIANLVARDMVVQPHRDGGQAQFIETPVPVCEEEDALAGTLAWAAEHLDEDLSLESLAAYALMSPRTFGRRFRAATGTTPLRWVTSQRINLAQRLLETTDLPIDLVAERSGFGTAASLRLQFQRHVRTTPQAYRRTFQQLATT